MGGGSGVGGRGRECVEKPMLEATEWRLALVNEKGAVNSLMKEK